MTPEPDWYLVGVPMSAIRDMAAAPDAINGLFEFIGALLVINSIRVLLYDRAVQGVSVFSCCAFSTWGVWNLFYYPYLGQWLSFAGGACLCAANLTWVGLMLFFKSFPRKATQPITRCRAMRCEETPELFATGGLNSGIGSLHPAS